MPEFIRHHGFVSKGSAAGQALLDRLYRQSHLFILPTRYEAYGLVFVEAASYGLPSLASAVGGVTTIVRNNANGQLFAPDATPVEYADYAERLLQNPARYAALCRSAFDEYEQRLNWKRFGETVRELVSTIAR